MFDFVKDVKITRVSAGATAAFTDVESDRVDMTGFDSVLFVCALGAVTSGGVVQLVAKSNAADSASNSTTEKSGTSITTSSGDYDNKLLIVDLHRPTLRYAYVTVVRDTQNAAINYILAIQYNAKNVPITQGSTVGDLVFAGPLA